MTSEEFKDRFQHHPLGYVFQMMEVTETASTIEPAVSMAEGILMLLEFQGDITKEEYEFLREALQGNLQRNLKRIKKTNAEAPNTQQ